MGELNKSRIGADLFGRVTIYASSDEISQENVIEQVNEALSYHIKNLFAEEYLYWYRRGVTPILNRHKEIRPEINNKVCESAGIAASIVDFKNGYFLTQPANYISRNEGSQESVNTLNEYLYRSGKHQADNKIADWFHTVGKAALYVEPSDDNEAPVKCYALDPRSAFVVYSMKPGNKPVMGINTVTIWDEIKIDVYTDDSVYHLSGNMSKKLIASDPNNIVTAIKLDSVDANTLGHIPIIEYRYNSVNMGAFEGAITLLDLIDTLRSNAADGVEQAIQSLVVTWNCAFEEGMNANTIRKYGMVNLKSSGENKQDLKILTDTIDQNGVLSSINSVYERVLTVCAVPSTTKGGMSTSDTGQAVLYRDGWATADCDARNTEDLFKESNRYFDEIFLDILKRKGLLDIKMSDFELNFVRNETANVQSKAQAFQTLLAAGLHPELAAAKSGISNDPVADIKASEKYLKMIWGDPDAEPEDERDEGGLNDISDAV